MENLTERMRSRCRHRLRAIPPCASERPRRRRCHRPSRNPDGSTDRSEESRTSRPRPADRSPPISTVRSEGSRDADLRAVRDFRGPKRATRTDPLLAPTPSRPKPFERRSSRRARSSRLPRVAHDGHTVHAGHRHEGSRHVTAGLEPKLRDNRRARGVAHAPGRHPRDTSTRHPRLPNRRPRSPRPNKPDVSTGSTRPRSKTWTSGCPLCRHRRRRQLRSAAPASLPSQHAAFESRPLSHDPPALRCDCVHARDRTPKPVLLSKRSHLPIPLDAPNRPCRRRRRRARPLEFALHRQFRTVSPGDPVSTRQERTPTRQWPDASRNPRLPLETKPQRSSDDLPTSPCGVATARLHGVRRSSIAPRPPSGRTLPTSSRTTHVAEPEAVSRGDRSGVATVTAAARHLRSRRSTDPTPRRMRKASALHPVAPKRRTTRPLRKRYRATSPGRPAGRSRWTDPVRHPTPPDVATGAHAPPREHGSTTRPRRKSGYGDGCPEAFAVHAPRPRSQRTSRADHGAVARSPTCPVDSDRSHRRRRAPTSRRLSGQRKRRALAGRSQLEPCTDESRTVPVQRQTLRPPRPRSRRRRHIQRIPDGCLVVATPHPPRPRPRRMPRTWQLPDGCPVVTALPPPRPKPKRPSHKRLPDGARSAPRSALPGRSRRRRHVSEFRTCPRSHSSSSRSQRTATRRDVDTGRRRGHHAPEAEAPNTLALDHPTPARAVQLPATEAVGVHRIQPTWNPLPSCGHENASGPSRHGVATTT